MTKMQCPRCLVVYGVHGDLPQNPGGMGAKPGWSCTFCVIDPPLEEKLAWAQRVNAPMWANCWQPIYLRPYNGPRKPEFAVRPPAVDAGEESN